MKLPPALVEAARKEEIDTGKNWKPKAVWKNVPRQKATDAGKKPIGTRWVDVNKGDDTNIIFRSRPVGQEFKRWEGEAMFAATPPYVCGMYLYSRAVTYRGRRGQRLVIMFLDVKKAFWHAEATELIFIELPHEAKENPDVDEVGEMQMSLYGTRSAARNWAAKYTTVFIEDLCRVKQVLVNSITRRRTRA